MMKIFKSIILLIILACVTLLAELIRTQTDENFGQFENLKEQYTKNIRTSYNIEVKYDKPKNVLTVKEKIEWRNTSNTLVDTIYFNIPKNLPDNGNEHYRISYKINSFTIDNRQVELEFIENGIPNFLDSTLAKVFIPNRIGENESVQFIIDYSISLPQKIYFNDYNLYNFENWYVTITPYLDGKFSRYPLHQFIEPFLEYSNYSVKIKIPKAFNIAAPGGIEKEIINNDVLFTCSAKGITRFNWFLFNELEEIKKTIHPNGKNLDVILFIRERKNGYAERYFDATEKYLTSLSKFSDFPFKNLIIVDLPNTKNIGNKSYPNVVALKSDLISPVKTHKIEYNLALLLSEQYFGNIVTSNNITESWLSKGISAYLAEKLVRTYFGDLYSFFNIASYYPVYGLNFMTFGGIPVIYTITEEEIPEGARYINDYYQNITFADLSMPSYCLPDYQTYKVASMIKPQIALLTLRNYMGDIFEDNLKKYFETYKFNYPTAINFMETMTKNCSQEKKEFYEELFASGKRFDYAIKYIEAREKNKYDIMVERIEEGVVPIVINVNTANKKIKLYWNGKEKFKIFSIYSEDKIISAELDPENKNLLDINFSNNSYIVEEQYWGAFSLATRVFFWFQNALMLIGGVG